MGAIWIRGSEFIGFLHEMVGFKLGLAVSAGDLRHGLAKADLAGSWPDEHDALYRYRSEEVEAITGALLRHFGRFGSWRG